MLWLLVVFSLFKRRHIPSLFLVELGKALFRQEIGLLSLLIEAIEHVLSVQVVHE